MTDEGERMLSALVLQWRRYQERSAYLYDHQDDPEWAALDERTQRSGERVGEMRDALAAWAGVGADVVTLLMVECGAGQEEFEEACVR